MTDSTLGFVISFGIALATSIVYYSKVGDYFWACLGSVITSVVLFHLVAFLYSGYWDPFTFVSVVINGLESLVVAIAVGFAFALYRKRVEPRHLN
jgi:hypothetical protein